MENNSKPTLNIQPDLPAGKAGMQPSLPQADATSQQAPQRSSKTLWYIGIVVLILLGGLYAALQKPKTPSYQTQPVIQPTSTPKLPRSKAPGVITNVLTASSLDAQGNALTPATTFAKTDKTIYLVLTVNNPKVGTKVEYIRYLNGKLLDSGTTKLVKSNVTNTSFVWSLKKLGATHLVGNYKVKVYTNGIFEKEVSYTVY